MVDYTNTHTQTHTICFWMKRSIISFFVNMYMLTCLPQPCLTFCNPMDCSPPGVGFLWQEYWSGLPFPSPGDFPDSGIKTTSLVSCIAGGFSTVWVTREALWLCRNICYTCPSFFWGEWWVQCDISLFL